MCAYFERQRLGWRADVACNPGELSAVGWDGYDPGGAAAVHGRRSHHSKEILILLPTCRSKTRLEPGKADFGCNGRALGAHDQNLAHNSRLHPLVIRARHTSI